MARLAATRPIPLLPRALAVEVALGLVASNASPPVLVITYISPVASLLTYSRPLRSQARPAGRKQLPGQAVVLLLEKMGVSAEVLDGDSVGEPLAPKLITLTE